MRYILIVLLLFLGCDENSPTASEPVYGCTNQSACNFNPNATILDDTCRYEIDECGICGGDNLSCIDCNGIPNGAAYEDNCGTCDNYINNDCIADCNGDFGGTAVEDCAGVCGGIKTEDECGVCDGLGAIYDCGCSSISESECDCNGNILDNCDICGGDGTSCPEQGGDDGNTGSGGLYSLYAVGASVNAGKQVLLEVSLSNDNDVSGFQFVLSDNPDILSYVSISSTDRTSSFSVSAVEGEGGVTLIGFSFTGSTIVPGDGPILEVTYDIGIVEFDTNINMGISGSILSDPSGSALDHDSIDALFSVTASELMVPTTPENVVVEGGQNGVTISWDTVWQTDFYIVWRVGTFISQTSTTSTYEINLNDVTEYCYSVQAFNSVGESELSKQACAVTLPKDTGPPVISISSASIEAGDVFELKLSLENPSISVAGLQAQIMDSPNQLNINNIVGTERIEGFELSFNSQNDGSVLMLAFNLSGGTILPGSGPIAIISFESTSIYESTISMNLYNTILSDGSGEPIDHISEDGTVIISGKETP